MNTPTIYEYAGFLYRIDDTSGRLLATPLPGQHPAAHKEKHRRAAIELFLEDNTED